jgi:acetyl-CoA acetyltransferase family protein
MLALRSQQRTGAAQAAGFFDDEIVPVTIPQAKGDPVVVSKDEHPRPDTTIEQLTKLRPIVRPDGTITAGNASGVNDGAAVLLLASDAAVQRYGLAPRARVVGSAAAGVLPRVMGIGPVPATQKLLERLRWSIEQVDTIELNEAFAAQGLAVIRQLGLADDDPLVNPNGGAIALGHPLGASGARLALTALRQLESMGGSRALVTLCIGVGQGLALALERD